MYYNIIKLITCFIYISKKISQLQCMAFGCYLTYFVKKKYIYVIVDLYSVSSFRNQILLIDYVSYLNHIQTVLFLHC